jgi:hypothetical protein
MTSASPAHPTARTIVSQDFMDGSSGAAYSHRVRIQVVRDEDQSLGERPAATSSGSISGGTQCRPPHAVVRHQKFMIQIHAEAALTDG